MRSGAAQDEIWVMDADGSDKQQLTDGSVPTSGPAWSPDGDEIAFGRAGEVWTMAPDGSDQQLLISDATAPEYAPDGSGMAFVRSDMAAGSRIWVREAGGATSSLTAFNDRVTRPSWSPNSQRILFWHDSGNVEGLYTMAADGTSLQLLKAGPLSHFRSYTWSPSGTRIAYTGSASGNEEIWVMDADGTDAVQITDLGDAVEHQAVAWSTPPELDPVDLPLQTQGVALTPLQLNGPAGATFAVTGGQVPPGLSVSGAGVLSGTPTLCGRYVFEVSTTGGGAPTTSAYAMTVRDPEDPLLTITSPTAPTAASILVNLTGDTTVRWARSDPTSGSETADIRFRSAAWNATFGPLQSPQDWSGRTDLLQRQSLSAGRTYCYSGRATDRSGRTGAWSSEKCIVTPLDDGALKASSGWNRVSSSGYVGGKALRTKKKGRTLRRTGARLTRVGIVATTCPTCGKVAVSVGSTRIGTINLRRGSTALNRKAILLPRFSARTGTVTIKTLTKKRAVIIDALIVSAS